MPRQFCGGIRAIDTPAANPGSEQKETAAGGTTGPEPTMKTTPFALLVSGFGMLALLTPAASDESRLRNDTDTTPSVTAALAAPHAEVRAGLAIGDRLDPAQLHVITRPGLYGLTGNSPDRFGLVNGNLLRFDPKTMRLKSIIRTGVRMLD